MKWLNKQIEKLNLYERNTYRYITQYVMISKDRPWYLGAFLYTKCNKYVFRRNYLNYIEVPITTRCSLKCKECSNLIQFYNNPNHIDWKQVVKDINRLCKIVDGVGMLRILGGEPLLHPYLPDIIEKIGNNSKIQQIQIVTNGTLLCSDKLLNVLSKNKKVSVDISYYKEKSIKYEQLICQLKSKGIKFHSNKNLIWTEQSNCKCRHRKANELEKVFDECRLDCISMLDGKVHLCPRSSHGMDLKLIPVKHDEYIDLRNAKCIKEETNKLYKLMNIKAISACNYCDVFQWQKLKKCVAGEQISKEKANAIYDLTVRYNWKEQSK